MAVHTRTQAAAKATKAAALGQPFEATGLEEEHRDLFDQVSGEVADIKAKGLTVNFPWDYADD